MWTGRRGLTVTGSGARGPDVPDPRDGRPRRGPLPPDVAGAGIPAATAAQFARLGHLLAAPAGQPSPAEDPVVAFLVVGGLAVMLFLLAACWCEPDEDR